MADIQVAKYRLNPERSPGYRLFMKRLLCPDVFRRYTAAEALVDPWILGNDWTEDQMRAKVDAMDTSSVVVPTGYAQADWMAQVKKVMDAKGDGGADEPEMQDDDEEDAF
jgi:hypothetical protein